MDATQQSHVSVVREGWSDLYMGYPRAGNFASEDLAARYECHHVRDETTSTDKIICPLPATLLGTDVCTRATNTVLQSPVFAAFDYGADVPAKPPEYVRHGYGLHSAFEFMGRTDACTADAFDPFLNVFYSMHLTSSNHGATQHARA